MVVAVCSPGWGCPAARASRAASSWALWVAITAALLALGTPAGALIGGLGDWRWTMVFVSALAAVSGLGVWALLSELPLPPAIGLAKRLAPVADPRVALTLLDEEYDQVKGFAYVVIGGNKYHYQRTAPPQGLVSVGIWTIYARTDDEG